jgi:hypothetical protein
MIALATFMFPVGLIIDILIIAGIIYSKKRENERKKLGFGNQGNRAYSSSSHADDFFKVAMMSMLADKMNLDSNSLKEMMGSNINGRTRENPTVSDRKGFFHSTPNRFEDTRGEWNPRLDDPDYHLKREFLD